MHNPIDNQVILDTVNGGMRGEISHLKSYAYHPLSLNIFRAKWGDINIENWNTDKRYTTITECKLKNHIYYPYFEMDIIDLLGKNYII